MNLHVSKNKDELSNYAANSISQYIHEVLKKKDRFTIALSGGSTPEKLYSLLAEKEYSKKINWAKIHFFWGDERFVPFTDKRNNAAMAFTTLLNHVPVRKENIHIMRTDISPEESAAAYEKILHDYFDRKKHSFDLVLLGLGDNAHTLSLFPGYDIIHEKKNWVKSFYLKEQQMHRISLTVPVVNNASRIIFLISGKDKAASLYNVLYAQHDPDLYPAQIIQPFSGELFWCTDEAAAADVRQ